MSYDRPRHESWLIHTMLIPEQILSDLKKKPSIHINFLEKSLNFTDVLVKIFHNFASPPLHIIVNGCCARNFVVDRSSSSSFIRRDTRKENSIKLPEKQLSKINPALVFLYCFTEDCHRLITKLFG